MQTTNGQSEPFAKLAEVAVITGKRPTSWSTALELVRKARGWGQKQLLVEALKGENVTVAEIKRWELARSTPTLNQCHKLRAAMPALCQFDDLLRLDLRADPKQPKKGPLPAQKPAGWPGPPVKHFGEALKWVRVQHGMSQADLSKLIGVVTTSPWEREGNVMIRETYEHLCEILPELRHAPEPKFSQKYQNRIKAKGFLASQELHQETARANARIATEPVPTPGAPAVQTPDHAPLNSAGANYGVLHAAVLGLEAELARMTARHDEEKLALMGRIEEAKRKSEEAAAAMVSAAKVLHSGAR